MAAKLHPLWNAFAGHRLRFILKQFKFPHFIKEKQFSIASLFFFFLLLGPLAMAQSFTEDFESGIPNDWGLFRNGSANIDWQHTPDGYQSNGAAFLDPALDNIGAGNQGSYYLVTPYLSLPENAQLHFRSKFDALGDSNTVFKVMISTAPQPDLGDFIMIDSWNASEVDNYLTYGKHVVDLTSIGEGVEVYIAFVVENTQPNNTASGTAWFVDDLQLVTTCQPVNPQDVVFNNFTTSSAEISWSHPIATSFDIQVVAHDVAIDENAGENVNSTSYTVTNLEPETEYDVYIRSYCVGSITSAWQLAGTFETLKFGMTCSEPINIEGNSYYLSSNTKNFPNALNDVYPSPGTNCFAANVTQNYLAGNKIYFSYTAEFDGVLNLSQMTLPFTAGSGCFGNSASAVFIYEDCDAVGVECLAAVRTTATNRIEKIENFPVTTGSTYTIVISTSTAGATASVCFNFSLEFSQCPSPNEILYTDLLQNSVKFSWNNPSDLASSWEYAVLPVTEDAPTGAGTPTNTNENNIITGLVANTAYNFYVRSSCSGESGAWGEAKLFTTQCEAFNLPYFTDFLGASSNNPEQCWSVLDVNNDGVKWGFLANYATIVTSTNQNNNHDYLISPNLDFGNSNLPKKLRFKQQVLSGSNATSSYSIRLSTTGIGLENFTEVIVSETTITNSPGWQEVTYDIPDGITGNVNIAWVVSPVGSGHTASRLSIDDVFVFEECNVPTNLDVAETTETSALLTWTPSSINDIEWEVIIQPRGQTAPLPQDSGTLVNTNNYLAEGLEDSTRLEYYVRTSCSESAKSDWVGPIEFFTLCTTVVEPYYETFNLNLNTNERNDPDTKRYCWEILDENNDGASWTFTDTYAEINLNENGNDDWLISPAIVLNGDYHQVEFLHKGIGNTTYDLQLLISETDTDPDSFTEVAFLNDNASGNPFQEMHKYFQASGTIYLAIRISPDSQASANTSIQIDNFSVKVAASCPSPLDIQREVQTNTFTWTQRGSETQWEVVLLTAGQTIPRSGIIVNEPNYTVEGDLEEGMEYRFYVRAICDTNNLSDWTGPLRFVTDCNQVFASPFMETFEMDSESINCWTPNAWVLDNVLTPFEGQYSANVYTWGPGSDRWMISPTIEVEEGEMLSFYYKASEYAPIYTEDLKVWLSTTGNTIESFDVLLFEVHSFGNTEYTQAVVALPAGVSGEINIAFEIPQEITNANGFRQNVFIDNIEVKPIPDCPQPFNIEISSLQDVQVELSWGSVGDVDEWEVLVLPYNTSNPFDNIDPANIQILTSNPGMVTGLEPATAYDMYIRPICSDTNIGDWSELIPVVTLCSMEDQCLYTITLHSGDRNLSGISAGIQVIQNNQVIQTLDFPTGTFGPGVIPIDYQVYLCDGAAFTLFWDSSSAPTQYPEAYVKVTNSDGEEVWMSELGIGTPRTEIYNGIASCSEITCAQPTDLAIDTFGEFSWVSAGVETQWEVYIQPYRLGALPSQGVLVSQASYMPVETDFINGAEGIYEYFVRAVCSDTDKSYWSGPFGFILNDDNSNALIAPVNEGASCENSLDDLTFMGSTASTVPVSIGLPHNSGDIWVEFEAVSKTHSIELGSFSGTHNDAGYPELPKIVMVLYKETAAGALEEIGWSENNVLYTMYSSELEIGENYKLRLINTNEQVPNKYTFNVCITTIDPCTVDAPNYSFEKPGMVSSHTIATIYFDNVIPGWRDNSSVLTGKIKFWGTENDFFPAYHGGQMVQLTGQTADGDQEPPAEGSSEVYGVYQDFNSSEITQYDYNFTHRLRGSVGGTSMIQLYAGPVGGPYSLIKEEATTGSYWQTVSGKYDVPEGQGRTRFIFRPKNYFGSIILDAANFVANNDIITSNHVLACTSSESLLRANGYGEWSASAENPGEVILSNATSNETSVSGFIVPGEYTFYWNTRYCEDTITITYEGIIETPEVDSPVEYCQGTIAEPLTASALSGFTLVFYTEEVGGEGISSITPDTSELGSTTYYVAYENAEGCEGIRVPIVVVVYELFIPEVEFSYDAEGYCQFSDTAVIEYVDDFTLGGTFTAIPTGLAIDATDGSIDLVASDPGVYEVTYIVEAGEGLCEEGGDYTVTVEVYEQVIPELEFSYDAEAYCPFGDTPVIEYVQDFTIGGTFTATPSGLAIDATDGSIDLTASDFGVYEVTYTIDAGDGPCEEGGTYSVTVEVLEQNVPEVIFSYDAQGYCPFGETPVIEYESGFTFGGTFSATPDGLAIDVINGSIDLASSTTGVYEVTYTVDADEEICNEGGSYTVEVAIYEQILPNVEFSYNLAAYCPFFDTALIEYMDDFTFGGTFTATPEGLAIDATDGSIDLTASDFGVYEVTYTIDAGDGPCEEGGSYSVNVEVLEQNVPEVIFSYDAQGYCPFSDTPVIEYVSGFTFGGTFTATPNGLAIDVTNGSIDLASSTTGVYEVTYTVDADGEICNEGGSYSVEVAVYEQILPNVEFSYNLAAYCPSFDTALIEYMDDFTFGGTFTATPEGLAIDAADGSVDLESSDAGIYEVTYTINADENLCQVEGTYSVVFEIYEPIIPNVAFSYDSEVYCSAIDAPIVAYTDDFTFGGEFTVSPSGLAIDAIDGSIDLEASAPGIYEVKYTIEADEELCQVGDSYSVEITFVNAVAFNIDTYCEVGRFMLAPEFNSETDMGRASFTWREGSGGTVGTGRTLDFASAMGSNVDLPITISLTVEIDGCEVTQEIVLENTMCKIPKGISPNGDGLNDSFDLSGMSVQHITIFNRYGAKVYSKANYTNEWAGQSDKDKELPDGTYYYVVETKAGESITGWVYVNRAY